MFNHIVMGIPELKRVIVGYEDKISMERTLDEALQKIFTGLTSVESKLDIIAENGSPSGRIILDTKDFARIKTYFKRALQSQKSLTLSLGKYKTELEALGNALESARTAQN